MSGKGARPGYIQTPADTQPRPLTDVEAQQVFATLASKGAGHGSTEGDTQRGPLCHFFFCVAQWSAFGIAYQ